MLRKKVLVPFFSLLIFVIPVFASIDLIEEDISEYKYLDTNSYEPDYFFPSYVARYNDSSGQFLYVTITEFNDNKHGEDYLSDWISPKIEPNSSLKFNNYSIFKFDNLYHNLIWRHNNFYIKIQLSGDYDGLPDGIIEAYLDIYPSDCSDKTCAKSDISIEAIYRQYFLGHHDETNGLYFKHNGFSIRCRNVVKYGREGRGEFQDLDYNQFKEKVNQYLYGSMYFSESELNNLHDKCIEEEVVEIKGLPLDGFLKDCYNRVSPRLTEGNKYPIDETSLRLCDNMDLIMSKQSDFFDRLIEVRGSTVILNQIMDFLVQKKLESRERQEEACEDWEEGDEEIAGCDNNKREEDDEDGAIALRPCTEEDLENFSDCTPIKKSADKKIIEKEESEEEIKETIKADSAQEGNQDEDKPQLEIKEESKTEEQKEKQEETMFIRIISIFKRLFS